MFKYVNTSYCIFCLIFTHCLLQQYIEWQIATQRTPNFKCTESYEVSSSDNYYAICRNAIIDSYLTDSIVPQEGEILRGSSTITISTVLNRVELCIPNVVLKPFTFSLVTTHCDYCESSGKLVSLFDTKHNLDKVNSFYSLSNGYTLNLKFEKAPEYRNALIDEILTTGNLILSVIMTATGWKGVVEVVSGLASCCWNTVIFESVYISYLVFRRIKYKEPIPTKIYEVDEFEGLNLDAKIDPFGEKKKQRNDNGLRNRKPSLSLQQPEQSDSLSQPLIYSDNLNNANI